MCLASQGKVPAWGNGPKIRMEKGGKEKGEGAAFESTSLSSIERFLGGGIKVLNIFYKQGFFTF